MTPYDYEMFKKELEEFDNWNADMNEDLTQMYGGRDMVNSPSHYTRGTSEAIDIIEDAIQDAPTPVEGMLQAQALKYLLRLWLKDNPEQDAKKAKWYLERLIKKIES